jgi:hypothetical protein
MPGLTLAETLAGEPDVPERKAVASDATGKSRPLDLTAPAKGARLRVG